MLVVLHITAGNILIVEIGTDKAGAAVPGGHSPHHVNGGNEDPTIIVFFGVLPDQERCAANVARLMEEHEVPLLAAVRIVSPQHGENSCPFAPAARYQLHGDARSHIRAGVIENLA